MHNISTNLLRFLLMLCLMAPALLAEKDSPETLMAAAKTYDSAGRKQLQKQTDRFFARLTRDRAYAASLFTAAQKNDKAAVGKIVAQGMAISPTRVTVSNLDRDVLVNLTIETEKSTISICVDSEDGRCDHGAAASVTIITKK